MNIHNASSWTAATKLRQGPFLYPWSELLQSCTHADAPQDRRDGKWAQAPGRLWNQGYANIFPHCRNFRTLHARRPQDCNVIPKGLRQLAQMSRSPSIHTSRFLFSFQRRTRQISPNHLNAFRRDWVDLIVELQTQI